MRKSIFIRTLLSCLMCSLLASCSIYKQQFDCPPPQGIPCTSVNEIESLIVETAQGPDLLAVPANKQEKGCFWCGKKTEGNSSLQKRKVWICPQNSSSKGYYQTEESVSNELSVNNGFLPSFFIQQKEMYEFV